MFEKTYEAMFVLDTSTKPLEVLQEEVRQLLERHGGKILKAEKWTERRLAYTIARKKRGTYYLVFFSAPASAIAPLNGEIRMREAILRALILENPAGEKSRIPTPPEEGDRPGAIIRPERDAFPAGIGH